ncbi:hypothetical protein DINM_001588 [Dirofilaria immitis]|nr:hypothetical protein [Dirofilaria immitis]
MQNSGVGPNQPVYYQQTQGAAMMMSYPQATTDQRQQQQQQQQIINMQGMPTAQMYGGPSMQSMQGRPYSAGTPQESSPGIRPSSQSQISYSLGMQPQMSNEQQQQQQQFQNRPSYQPQQQIQGQQSQQSTQRTWEFAEEAKDESKAPVLHVAFVLRAQFITGEPCTSESLRWTRAISTNESPPYSPEILNDLSKYSVAALACIGRELVQELLLRTYTLMTSLTKSVDRWHQQQGVSDPEQLLSYCEYILSKITEIRLRIDCVPVTNISEDEFITLMSDPNPPQKPPELVAKEETFEVQRRKLVKLNAALKIWIGCVWFPIHAAINTVHCGLFSPNNTDFD